LKFLYENSDLLYLVNQAAEKLNLLEVAVEKNYYSYKLLYDAIISPEILFI